MSNTGLLTLTGDASKSCVAPKKLLMYPIVKGGHNIFTCWFRLLLYSHPGPTKVRVSRAMRMSWSAAFTSLRARRRTRSSLWSPLVLQKLMTRSLWGFTSVVIWIYLGFGQFGISLFNGYIMNLFHSGWTCVLRFSLYDCFMFNLMDLFVLYIYVQHTYMLYIYIIWCESILIW